MKRVCLRSPEHNLKSSVDQAHSVLLVGVGFHSLLLGAIQRLMAGQTLKLDALQGTQGSKLD